MSDRRYNANTSLDPLIRRQVDELKLNNSEARRHFESVREDQLRDHPPLDGAHHTPAQRANATQMANKAVAMKFLGWP
jgi:hypothetical protein